MSTPLVEEGPPPTPTPTLSWFLNPQPSLRSTIVDLRLNENKIRSVHYSSLSRFGNLTYLNLTKNDISYVEDGAFSAQFNLQVSGGGFKVRLLRADVLQPPVQREKALQTFTIPTNRNQSRDVFLLVLKMRSLPARRARSLWILETTAAKVVYFFLSRPDCCCNELACLHGYPGGWSRSRG